MSKTYPFWLFCCSHFCDNVVSINLLKMLLGSNTSSIYFPKAISSKLWKTNSMKTFKTYSSYLKIEFVRRNKPSYYIYRGFVAGYIMFSKYTILSHLCYNCTLEISGDQLFFCYFLEKYIHICSQFSSNISEAFRSIASGSIFISFIQIKCLFLL